MNARDRNIMLEPQRKGPQIEADWDRELRALIETKAEMRVAKVKLCDRLGVCCETSKSRLTCKSEMSVKWRYRSYEECKLFSKSLESLEHQYEDEILILNDHIVSLRLQCKCKNSKN